MPLLRHSLYSQNVNLYLAPTADARDTWLPLMRTVAGEGRCFVLSANQCMTRANLPAWVTGRPEGGEDKGGDGDGATAHGIERGGGTDGREETGGEAERDFVSRGGSCVVSPLGEVLAGPLWDEEAGLLWVDVDFEDCLRGRLDLDVGGSYSR